MKKIWTIFFIATWLNLCFQTYTAATPIQDQNHDTIIWMTDTQYYSKKYPHIFENQIEWIISNQKKWNIQYVIHTGDIVHNSEQMFQWHVANNMMSQLDKSDIPYGILAGNHDLLNKKNYLIYEQFFGEDRFKEKDHYGGSYQNNKGHYDLLTLGKKEFIFLYMGWGIKKEEMDWMNQVLSSYKDRIAILNFHKYLHKNGKRTKLGDEIFEQVVKPNENVRVVLSGHYDDSEKLISDVDDNGDGRTDRYVYQILADYQSVSEGGSGFLRLIHFYPETHVLYMRTYSPYLNKHYHYSPQKHPEKDQFWIKLK
ncbi:metallophosphoesterase [Bacillus carboniphilus]|uniref:Metallophosphoesterase n=1 Tax=Bacillus carboniphilus TaxID=86663 RepID=A0ABY9JUW0_9BACI|nr:metallophosphoesterase [Bacillus carboniphilus]WLR41461.1 metallophosphoesterase [Bacillus carboniphilus]